MLVPSLHTTVISTRTTVGAIYVQPILVAIIQAPKNTVEVVCVVVALVQLINGTEGVLLVEVGSGTADKAVRVVGAVLKSVAEYMAALGAWMIIPDMAHSIGIIKGLSALIDEGAQKRGHPYSKDKGGMMGYGTLQLQLESGLMIPLKREKLGGRKDVGSANR